MASETLAGGTFSEVAEAYNQRGIAFDKIGGSLSGHERDFVALQDDKGAFVAISGVSGADSVGDGRGAAVADFDNDGDLDIFLLSANPGPSHRVLRNELGGGFLRLTLTGADEPDAWGAIVRVESPMGVLTRVKEGGAGYLSQHDPRLLFGLGDVEKTGKIEVRWPSGRVDEHPGLPARSSWSWVEGQGPERIDEKGTTLASSDELGDWYAVSLKRGDPLPDLGLKGLDGKPVTLATGRPRLINIWATWCVACKREMPQLQQLSDRIEVIGVSVDKPADVVKIPRFLLKAGVDYPVAIAPSADLGGLLTSGEVPISLLQAADGTVIDVFVGWDLNDRRAVEALIEAGP